MPRTPKVPEGGNGATNPRRPMGRPNGNAATVSSDEVAKRAYEIYQARGGQHGADMDDWLEAERQLKQQQQPQTQTERRKSPRP